MKNELLKLGFKKIPNGNLLQKDEVLIYLTKTDSKTRSYSIEEFNIEHSTLIRQFQDIFILVEINNNEYLLLHKESDNLNFGAYKHNKIGVRNWRYKYNIIPEIDDNDSKIAIIQNNIPLNDEDFSTEVLLDKESVFCILNDYIGMKMKG